MNARTRLVAALACAAIAAAPSPAAADMGPKWDRAALVPIGLNVGGAVHQGKSGFLLGPEISVVHIDSHLYWFGAYGDLLHDFGTSTTRMSLGPEAGIGPFGFDLGYVGELDGRTYRHGACARIVLSLAIVSLYGRYTHVFDPPSGLSGVGEFGFLFKVPIPIWEKVSQRRRNRSRPEPSEEPMTEPKPEPVRDGAPPADTTSPPPGPTPPPVSPITPPPAPGASP